jgi:hypothetical protein
MKYRVWHIDICSPADGIQGIIIKVYVRGREFKFIKHFLNLENEGHPVHALIQVHAGRSANGEALINIFLSQLILIHVHLQASVNCILV